MNPYLWDAANYKPANKPVFRIDWGMFRFWLFASVVCWLAVYGAYVLIVKIVEAL